MASTEVPSTYSYLTDTQERVIAFVPIAPALFSILGSCLILRLIVIKRRRRRRGGGGTTRTKPVTAFHRILFGMSLYDIYNSINVVLQSFLTPRDTSRRLYAVGNDATCNLLGFGFQFSYGSFLYFGALSLYYVLTVKFGMTEASFSKRVEPVLHAVIILFPLVTAVIGLALGLYAEVTIGAGCWLAESTPSCDAACMDTLEWIFGGGPFMFVFLMVLVNNVLIFCHVRQATMDVTRRSHDRMVRSITATGQASSETAVDPHTSPESHNDSFATVTMEEASSPRISTISPTTTDSITRASMVALESQQARVKLVGTQSLLYCVVFVLTYGWTIVLRLAENSDVGGPEQEQELFPFMVLRAIFLPAMGVGTLLVYARPRYLIGRRKLTMGEESRWRTFLKVVWDDDGT